MIKEVNDLESFDDELFKIILDPARAKILSLTHLYGNITQGQIKEKLKLSRSTISHHMKKLIEKDLLKVSISPIGHPVKTYSLSRSYEFKLDRKKIKELPIEESSNHLLDYLMSIALQYRNFGISSVESVKILRDLSPFDQISEDNQDNVEIFLQNKKIFIPPLIKMYTGEKEAKYIKDKLFSLIEDFQKQFPPKKQDHDELINNQLGYIINLAIFPFPRTFLQNNNEKEC